MFNIDPLNKYPFYSKIYLFIAYSSSLSLFLASSLGLNPLASTYIEELKFRTNPTVAEINLARKDLRSTRRRCNNQNVDVNMSSVFLSLSLQDRLVKTDEWRMNEETAEA